MVQLDWRWHPAGQIYGQLQIWAVAQPDYNHRTRRGQLRAVGDAIMFVLLAVHGSTLSVSLSPRLQNRAGSKRWQVRDCIAYTLPLSQLCHCDWKTGAAWSPSMMRNYPPGSLRHVLTEASSFLLHVWQASGLPDVKQPTLQ